MNPYDEDDEDDPIESYEDDRYEVVTFCSDHDQAEEIQALLSDHGIDVEIDDEGLYGEEADGVALIVPAADVEDARVVLDRLDMIEEIAVVESDDDEDDFDDDDDADLDELLELEDDEPLPSYDDDDEDVPKVDEESFYY